MQFMRNAAVSLASPSSYNILYVVFAKDPETTCNSAIGDQRSSCIGGAEGANTRASIE